MFRKVLIAIFAGLVLASPLKVHANEASFLSCDSLGENTMGALIKEPKGVFDVWVKAGRSEDVGNATLFVQPVESSDCNEVGQASISTDRWVKVGQLSGNGELVNLTLLIDVPYKNFSGASAPSVVLVDRENAPCSLDTVCQVTFRGGSFDLSPKKLSMSSDNLKVGLLKSVDDTSEINKVIYSIDDKPAYSSSRLADFNLNYVSVGEHMVTRTVILKDGQSLSESKKIKHGDYSNVKNLLVSWLYANKRSVIYLSVLFILILAWLAFLLIYRVIRRKRLWKMTHVASPVKHVSESDMSPSVAGVIGPSAPISSQVDNDSSYWQEILRLKKWLIGIVGIFALFIVSTTYVISVFTVDGVSMYPTLQDRSRHPLLLLPRTASRINNNYYIPSRGTVVVVQKEDIELFTPLANQPKSYVVKRVIGLPGERVVVKDGLLIVYNKEHPEGFEPDITFNWLEVVPPSTEYSIDVTLKDGEIFVVGDNRQESIDSRFYGPVNAAQIVGRVL